MTAPLVLTPDQRAQLEAELRSAIFDGIDRPRLEALLLEHGIDLDLIELANRARDEAEANLKAHVDRIKAEGRPTTTDEEYRAACKLASNALAAALFAAPVEVRGFAEITLAEFGPCAAVNPSEAIH